VQGLEKTPVARKDISDKDSTRDEILFFSMSNMYLLLQTWKRIKIIIKNTYTHSHTFFPSALRIKPRTVACTMQVFYN
jgi:hypothetical protein